MGNFDPEIHEKSNFWEAEMPNQTSPVVGWHGVGKPQPRAIERTPRFGNTSPSADFVSDFPTFRNFDTF